MTPPPDVLAAMAERMNRVPEVAWDRCVRHDGYAIAYGWIGRDDGRSDFVLLEFKWGETEGLDGGPLTWFGIGFATSSAALSPSLNARLLGEDAFHRECERIEDVFGALVVRKVEL